MFSFSLLMNTKNYYNHNEAIEKVPQLVEADHFPPVEGRQACAFCTCMRLAIMLGFCTLSRRLTYWLTRWR